MAEPGEAKFEQQTVKIYHTPGKAPTCVPDPIVISKKQKHEVVWTCQSQENFTVVMQSPSPFAQSAFTQDDSHSGEPILTPDTGKQLQFKYTVIVGKDTADPGVIIEP